LLAFALFEDDGVGGAAPIASAAWARGADWEQRVAVDGAERRSTASNDRQRLGGDQQILRLCMSQRCRDGLLTLGSLTCCERRSTDRIGAGERHFWRLWRNDLGEWLHLRVTATSGSSWTIACASGMSEADVD